MLERIKPLKDLVNEILDQLPEEVWSSDSTTFFDPAIGGGQFVAEVERRLRARGHSNDNINSRVYGFESSSFLTDTAKNMHGLVGQYTKLSYQNFFNLNEDVNFDVIVGNPPFQDINDEGDRKDPGSNLWTHFLVKSSKLLKKNGYLAMVSPDAWVTPYSAETTGGRKYGRECRKMFRDNQIVWLNYRECGRHFPGVGSAFTAFVVQKTAPNHKTTMVLSDSGTDRCNAINQVTDLKNFFWLPRVPTNTAISIIDKVFWKTNNFKILDSCGGNVDPVSTQDVDHPYPFWVAASTIKFSSKPHKHQYKKKVIVPALTTKEQAYYDPGTHGPVLNGANIEVKSDAEGQNLLDVIHSPLIQFCLQQSRWHHGYQMTYVLQSLPKIDIARSWTHTELCKHFGLTAEEQQYIIDNIR